MSTHYAFLHGGGQGSWVWRETIAALDLQSAGSYGRAIALDVPGCGAKRGLDTGGLTIENVADELLGDIDNAGMKNVVLVGHSQAGQAMCFMSRNRPDLFQRLVYVSCSIPLPGQNVQQMIGKGRHGEHDSEVGWPLNPQSTSMEERYLQMFCNDMPADQAASFLAELGSDMWPMQSYVHTDWPYDHFGDIPATYVLCMRDKSIPPRWQEIFAERFKSRRIVHVDAGHQVMVTRPHALAEILRHE